MPVIIAPSTSTIFMHRGKGRNCIRVNIISPGPTKTARFLVTRQTDPTQMDENRPLERYGTPQEVADGVAFLVSDSSKFITGQLLRVDGGMQIFPG